MVEWVGGEYWGKEGGARRGAADSADWWEMISSNFTCNTPGDKGLGGGGKEGEQAGRAEMDVSRGKEGM